MLPLWQEGSKLCQNAGIFGYSSWQGIPWPKACSWLPQGRGGFALDIEQVHYEYADLKKVLELVR
jgi:hypothetical protein